MCILFLLLLLTRVYNLLNTNIKNCFSKTYIWKKEHIYIYIITK